jgi:hypothetical protein
VRRALSIALLTLMVILLAFSVVHKTRAATLIHLEFDTFPGVLPYSDPNDNLYIGWTLDLSSPGASEGRDIVTQKIGASINGTVSISTGGTCQIDVWILDRGTTDKIRIDGQEWTFVAPATGHWNGTAWDEKFQKVTLGEILLSVGSHNITLIHVAPGSAGSYPENSILDYLEISLAQTLPFSASIDPLSATINIGDSITFTSTANGGTPPYNYQWYLSGNPVSGATSSSWTFSPTASGVFYVYLKVTDSLQPIGNTTQSETARIMVTSIPVGGYSVSLTGYSTAMPSSVYLTLLIMLSAVFTIVRRKTRRKK